jgi:hypothetical protein
LRFIFLFHVYFLPKWGIVIPIIQCLSRGLTDWVVSAFGICSGQTYC